MYLTGGVSLASLLLPGGVSALQLASLGPLHARLEAGDQVCAGSTRRQLGGGLLRGRIQTVHHGGGQHHTDQHQQLHLHHCVFFALLSVGNLAFHSHCYLFTPLLFCIRSENEPPML